MLSNLEDSIFILRDGSTWKMQPITWSNWHKFIRNSKWNSCRTVALWKNCCWQTGKLQCHPYSKNCIFIAQKKFPTSNKAEKNYVSTVYIASDMFKITCTCILFIKVFMHENQSLSQDTCIRSMKSILKILQYISQYVLKYCNTKIKHDSQP